MLALELLAEHRIQEALARGELDHLPSSGPLVLDDDAAVPEDLRMAYRILKNAGFLPPEVEARREIAALERLVAQDRDDAARTRAFNRLALLRAQVEHSYYDKVLRRLTR